jgi:hypothetical protein
MPLERNKLDVEDFGDEVVMLELETGTYWSVKGTLTGLARALLASHDPAATLAWWNQQPETQAEIGAEFIQKLGEHGLLFESGQVANADFAEIVCEPGAPRFTVQDDLADLVKLDPIHDVGSEGWPNKA